MSINKASFLQFWKKMCMKSGDCFVTHTSNIMGHIMEIKAFQFVFTAYS